MVCWRPCRRSPHVVAELVKGFLQLDSKTSHALSAAVTAQVNAEAVERSVSKSLDGFGKKIDMTSVDKLAEQVKTKDAQISALEKRLSDIESKLTQTAWQEIRVKSMEEKLGEFGARMNGTKLTLDADRKALDDLSLKIKKLEDDASNWGAQLSALNNVTMGGCSCTSVSERMEKIHELTECRLNSLQSDFAAVENSMEVRMKPVTDKIVNLQKELESMKSNFLKKNTKVPETNMDNLEVRVNELRDAFDKAQREFSGALAKQVSREMIKNMSGVEKIISNRLASSQMIQDTVAKHTQFLVQMVAGNTERVAEMKILLDKKMAEVESVFASMGIRCLSEDVVQENNQEDAKVRELRLATGGCKITSLRTEVNLEKLTEFFLPALMNPASRLMQLIMDQHNEVTHRIDFTTTSLLTCIDMIANGDAAERRDSGDSVDSLPSLECAATHGREGTPLPPSSSCNMFDTYNQICGTIVGNESIVMDVGDLPPKLKYRMKSFWELMQETRSAWVVRMLLQWSKHMKEVFARDNMEEGNVPRNQMEQLMRSFNSPLPKIIHGKDVLMSKNNENCLIAEGSTMETSNGRCYLIANNCTFADL